MDSGRRKDGPENPNHTANPLSRLFFWWLWPYIWQGYRKVLHVDDLYQTLPGDRANLLADKLEKEWTTELQRAKVEESKPKLISALFRCYWVSYTLSSIPFAFSNLVLRVLQPWTLGRLLAYFLPDSDVTETEAYIYAATICLINFLKMFFDHHFWKSSQLIGMRMRIACCSLIYRKVLRLNKQVMDQSATGQIINLLSNDVARFDMMISGIVWLPLCILQVIFVTYCTYLTAGPACFAGLAYVVTMTIPVQGFLGKLSAVLRGQIAVLTDERVKLMNEIVSGVQVIKMYAWEKPFAHLAALARKNEVAKIMSTSYIRAFSMSSLVFTERASLFCTLLAYTLLGNTINAEKVFSLAQYYNVLNVALAAAYPMAVNFLAEGFISVHRIEEFLIKEERISARGGSGAPAGQVALQQVEAHWTEDHDSLLDVSLHISPGNLCAIIGPVGSGKTTLLHLLLGELPVTSGALSVGGTISYASQEPWIFVGTVRQNILFGQEYNEYKYNEVVRACALQRDFQLLPYGDATLVGEKGITLSGGQRARINLARAVYQDADIYLLDDPLSAVDTHVGRHLFDECISGLLSHKTCILVTHQLQYLEPANIIVVLNEGQVEATGSFEEIKNSGLNFAKLLSKEEEEDLLVPTSPKQLEPSLLDEAILRRSKRISTRYQVKSTLELPDEPTAVSVIVTESGQVHNDQYYNEEIAAPKGSTVRIFWKYFKAGGALCTLISLLFMLLLAQATTSGADYWVTYWTNLQQKSIVEGNSLDSTIFLEVYGGIVLACILITFARSVFFFLLSMKASRNLHNRMFENVLHATMNFFDKNPAGRVLNRFSKDVGAMDELLPQAMLTTIQIMLVLFGILLMVAIANYWLLLPMIFFGAVFIWVSKVFVATSRQTKLLEGIQRSHVFSHVTDTLNGLQTIRSSSALIKVSHEFDTFQDDHTSAWSLFVATGTGLGFWLDNISSIFITIVTFTFLAFGPRLFEGANVGLAISQSLILTGMLQYGIQQLSQVISQMTSVERIIEYTKLPAEPSLISEPEKQPPASWPSRGCVKFQNVTLKYDSVPVLRNLNFTIPAGNKVGIVGRTGAGKSSMLTALFRLAPIEGTVTIDDINYSTLGLHDLRRKISIIPQEPVLFSASLRYNLDPFNEFEDAALFEALQEVELKFNLDVKVSEGGSNFSVGQRQLVCLARAILRNNKILVLDEATANVDPETDMLIQKTIRRKFTNCTVLTIAHRLHSIMDSDRIIVMDAGCVMEYDHPYVLLQNKFGAFSKLVAETGDNMVQELHKKAEDAFRKKVETGLSTTDED